MNVKYRENIIRINNKEIEMKSKNILELKEVKNMLHIEKINGKNVWEILKLHVSESQKEFVAANDVSIIEAYATITANGFAFPFGIYDNKTPVGFMMIGYDSADYWEDAPDIARGNYSLWRLMIDENYQKKGFGREAVALGLDFIKSFIDTLFFPPTFIPRSSSTYLIFFSLVNFYLPVSLAVYF